MCCHQSITNCYPVAQMIMDATQLIHTSSLVAGGFLRELATIKTYENEKCTFFRSQEEWRSTVFLIILLLYRRMIHWQNNNTKFFWKKKWIDSKGNRRYYEYSLTLQLFVHPCRLFYNVVGHFSQSPLLIVNHLWKTTCLR